MAEIHSRIKIKKQKAFDKLIERRWGTLIYLLNAVTHEGDKDFKPYEDDDKAARIIPDIEDIIHKDGKLLDQQPVYDTMINAEVQLQQGHEFVTGKVKRHALGPDGRMMGSWSDNPIMNSMIHEVEFPDGQAKEDSANIIAENSLLEVDSDGYSMQLMQVIVDYKCDDIIAVQMADQYVFTKSGQKCLCKSTSGLNLLVHRKDGSESWINLSEMKESHPVETAEFAKAQGINQEPAFILWVPYTLCKRDVILATVKSRVMKKTHKYGIEIPRSIKHTYELDAKNGNTMW